MLQTGAMEKARFNLETASSGAEFHVSFLAVFFSRAVNGAAILPNTLMKR